MKKRIRNIVLIYAAIVFAAVLYYILFTKTHAGIPCIFNSLTGLSCPSCGLTRAVVAISRGQFLRALSLNCLIYLYIVYGVWFAAMATVRYIKGREDPLLFGPAAIHITIAAITVIFGIVRNIVGI